MSTPLRRQYLEIKRRHPGMLLLFQIGDFYETFDEDAQTLARELGVVLTRKWFGKGDPHPLAGVPVRALASHLAKLIQRGHKVALCDQVTPPGQGLVERQVTRIITPGTVMEPALLEGRANNYLACLIPGERTAGLAYADVSTGEFRATELPGEQAHSELARIAPAELLAPRDLSCPPLDVRAVTCLTDDQIQSEAARAALLQQFEVATLAAYGLEGWPLATTAAGALLAYLRDTQPEALRGLTTLQSYSAASFMQLDPQTLRNLEIFHSWDVSGGTPAGSLLAAIDRTQTALGGRLLRRWLRHPLLDLGELQARQQRVAWFYERQSVRQALRARLAEVLDVERLLGRIRRHLCAPSELLAMAASLAQVDAIRAVLVREGAPAELLEPLGTCGDVVQLIERALSERPPMDIERGGVIRAGFSPALDELRTQLSDGRTFLAQLERRERARTGIRSLKVGYNKIFGYYIEVSKPNLRLVPADYVRKQTLTGAERFFTLDLKEHESLIANVRERIRELEESLFRQLGDEIGRHHERIGRVAAGLAQVDLYCALGEVAVQFHYTRPELDAGYDLEIVQGRHPMIERLGERPPFTPNDTRLSNGDAQIMLLTAPNMAGKSVYLRQVALICLLAQIGSFVPAQAARIGLLDRIFTRIGLNDNNLWGHSSFMSEMVETAHILHHAGPRSLVLLDEVGRGTSTVDGLAIARAVLEYLHNQPKCAAKTLFATHYHELTRCAESLPRVRNYHLAVQEHDGKLHYLHRVEPGRAERSFGIYVAQLAGLPRPVLRRAQQLLRAEEADAEPRAGAPSMATAECGSRQMAILDALRALDVNELSPIEALTQLYELQQRASAAG
jgi:DNA mismatch repair protein MutS